jgi:hypothetical protein
MWFQKLDGLDGKLKVVAAKIANAIAHPPFYVCGKNLAAVLINGVGPITAIPEETEGVLEKGIDALWMVLGQADLYHPSRTGGSGERQRRPLKDPEFASFNVHLDNHPILDMAAQ